MTPATESVSEPTLEEQIAWFERQIGLSVAEDDDDPIFYRSILASLRRLRASAEMGELKRCPKCDRMVSEGCNYCACPYPLPASPIAPEKKRRSNDYCACEPHLQNPYKADDGHTRCKACGALYE